MVFCFKFFFNHAYNTVDVRVNKFKKLENDLKTILEFSENDLLEISIENKIFYFRYFIKYLTPLICYTLNIKKEPWNRSFFVNFNVKLDKNRKEIIPLFSKVFYKVLGVCNLFKEDEIFYSNLGDDKKKRCKEIFKDITTDLLDFTILFLETL